MLLIGKPPPYALTVGGSVPDVVILDDPAIDVYEETTTTIQTILCRRTVLTHPRLERFRPTGA